MAKNKKKSYRRKPTIPIAVVAGFGPLVASGVRGWSNGVDNPDDSPWRASSKEVLYALTGVDIDNEPHFNPSFMVNGTIPILGGMLVHKLAGMLGVNRALGRMGMPYLRV